MACRAKEMTDNYRVLVVRPILCRERTLCAYGAEYGLEFTFRERDDLLDRRFGDPCLRNIVGSDELLPFERCEKCPYPSGIGVDGGLADPACCAVYGGMTLPCRALLEVEYKFPQLCSGHRRKIRVSIQELLKEPHAARDPFDGLGGFAVGRCDHSVGGDRFREFGEHGPTIRPFGLSAEIWED